MKTLAVMQPYFFPYLGYFKLMEVADIFLLYGEVSFRKKSWITRNRFQRLDDGRVFEMEVPVAAKSSQVSIRATRLAEYGHWRTKFLNRLRGNYHAAAHFAPTFEWIRELLAPTFETVHELNGHCLVAVANQLGIRSQLLISGDEFHSLESELSSAHGDGGGARRTERVTRLAKSLDCSRYLNPESGRPLYHESTMANAGVQFIGSSFNVPSYPSPLRMAEPGLSIIDVFMHNGIDQTRELLARCEAKIA